MEAEIAETRRRRAAAQRGERQSASPRRSPRLQAKRREYGAPAALLAETVEDVDPMEERRRKTVVERQGDYHNRRFDRLSFATQADPFAEEKDAEAITYAQVLEQTQLHREEVEAHQQASKRKAEDELKQPSKRQRDARSMDPRNRPFSDQELDSLIPSKGYTILTPPEGYVVASETVLVPKEDAFHMPEERSLDSYGISTVTQPSDPELPLMKPEDMEQFGELVSKTDEQVMQEGDKAKERKRDIMKLILRVKNGTPPMRKSALRELSQRATEFGAGPLFDQILPILMSPTLQDQERHLMVKLIDRVLYKLEDKVRPYAHKILVVIEPLLIDEDYYARIEGREIISNLAKAAGLATMIATMRPDIDNADEYVRNATAQAFAVVASTMGLKSLLPFFKAVCQSKKSWQARHTGLKIVHRTAILMGCAVLPHLGRLVEAVGPSLRDEHHKVRTMAALAVAALAESSAPYGLESFDSVLKPIWSGLRRHRGDTLSSFLKAAGFILPLMDPEYADAYIRHVLDTLQRSFRTPDEKMKKVVLQVLRQCVQTEGVSVAYIRDNILDEFVRSFWIRRTALDRRSAKQLIDTTCALAERLGAPPVLEQLLGVLKDEAEPFRKMGIESVARILVQEGGAAISDRIWDRLVDGALFCFLEHASDDARPVLDGFAVVLDAIPGQGAARHLDEIVQTVQWRLKTKAPRMRQLAADLVQRIAGPMKKCHREEAMGHLGVLLFENLGEEYPDVLGSLLGGLAAIVDVIGVQQMTPPVSELLPRLTPVLKNRHEKVQENCVHLVGRIADRGALYVSPREWVRICFELLELLKAHKKGIRLAAVRTFGFIAKAIGPSDVLNTLLNNLRVQERQNRVCTTIAIAIVAETCSPFTVLPALMNEYRVPEINVQNGVLKSLAFLFEYIGDMARDYVYAIAPLLEDALTDRDAVHRQTAALVIKHIALGVAYQGVEDALVHLLNMLWPNVLERSPHVIAAVCEALEALRVALGPTILLQHLLQGLFHPARKTRHIYWRIYNTLYVGAQDALVPSYPRITGYTRPELDFFI